MAKTIARVEQTDLEEQSKDLREFHPLIFKRGILFEGKITDEFLEEAISVEEFQKIEAIKLKAQQAKIKRQQEEIDKAEKRRKGFVDFLYRLMEFFNITGGAVATSSLDIEGEYLKNSPSGANHSDVFHMAHQSDNNIDNEAHQIGNGIGTVIATFFTFLWYVLRHKFPEKFNQTLINLKPKLNPWYRRFKTLFSVGNIIGSFVAEYIPLPHIPIVGRKILATFIGVTIGLIFGAVGAIFLSDGTTDKLQEIFKCGSDGWSKYVKTGCVAGAAVGSLIGFFVGGPAGALLGGLIGGIAGSILVSIAVPIINYVSPKRNKNAENPEGTPVLPSIKNFRTNHIRAGIVLGVQAGALFGTFIGLLCGGISAPLGAAAGSVIGAVVGGVIGGVFGKHIIDKFDPNNLAANSVDYAVRTGSLFGNWLGSICELVTSNKIIGTIVHSTVNLFCMVAAAAREAYHGWKINKENKKDTDHTIPYTQRGAGFGVPSAAAAGAAAEFAGGHGHVAQIVSAVAGIGGFLVGIFCDQGAQNTTKTFFKNVWNKTKTFFGGKDKTPADSSPPKTDMNNQPKPQPAHQPSCTNQTEHFPVPPKFAGSTSKQILEQLAPTPPVPFMAGASPIKISSSQKNHPKERAPSNSFEDSSQTSSSGSSSYKSLYTPSPEPLFPQSAPAVTFFQEEFLVANTAPALRS